MKENICHICASNKYILQLLYTPYVQITKCASVEKDYQYVIIKEVTAIKIVVCDMRYRMHWNPNRSKFQYKFWFIGIPTHIPLCQIYDMSEFRYIRIPIGIHYIRIHIQSPICQISDMSEFQYIKITLCHNSNASELVKMEIQYKFLCQDSEFWCVGIPICQNSKISKFWSIEIPLYQNSANAMEFHYFNSFMSEFYLKSVTL